MRFGLLALGSMMVLLVSAGCGGGGDGGPGPAVDLSDGMDGGSTDLKCIDKDGDGYGKNCGHSKQDCDDNDPKVLNDCFRCRYATTTNQTVDITDCPCDKGTKPKMCTPEDRPGDGGVFQCKEGNRYCRDGAWSSCEEAGQYVFVPN